MPPHDDAGRTLVIACAALAGDIRHVVATPGWDHVEFRYLPATHHNHPEHIVPDVQAILDESASDFDRVLVAYGDCGTGGRLDALLEEHPTAERLPGDHCYAFFAGPNTFLDLLDDEPGTFFLTDFLARNHEALVIGALGIDAHPELIDLYFGNYRRVHYLAQDPTPELTEAARQCANRLNLEFVQSNVGRGLLESRLLTIRQSA